MARPERFELPTTRFEAECSIQLSYGRKVLPKSSDPNSNDIRKCPADHRDHFLVTPKSHRFAPSHRPLIALPILIIRTSSLDVRSQVLYPAELRAQARSLTFAGHFWNLIQVRGLAPVPSIHYTNWLTFLEIWLMFNHKV
jgi:hypothetical protein